MSSPIVRFKRAIPDTWEEALQLYLSLKKAEGLREVTIKGHSDVVRCFFHRHPEAWPPDDPTKAVYAFMGENIAPATYNIRRNYLRQFFEWGRSEGICSENPLDRLRTRRVADRIVSISNETLQQLMSLPDLSTFAGLRDRALLLLTLDTGIRPQEAFRLMPEDFKSISLEILLAPENAKTGTARALPISPLTHAAIKALVAARAKEWGTRGPLFCTFEGTPMNRHSWNDRLELYSGLLGVKIRPYDLRHTFALQFLRNGGNVFALQRIMGHTTLNMTRRYLALSESDIREQHAKASPVTALLPERVRVRKVRQQ